MKKLGSEFFKGNDVTVIARSLLGKIVATMFDDKTTSGRIVETEAYLADIDKASHSYNGKRTSRNEHMYSAAGTIYVYICYGMHQMLNVVTNEEGIADAILIRAIEPLEGVEIMLQRTGKFVSDHSLTKGPGNVARALGIWKKHSGLSVLGEEINFFADENYLLQESDIGISKRIGVDGAGVDADLPYRFYIRGNKYVSGRPVK